MAAAPYLIFGAEVSPYSVKVRSYFRYKGLAHEWRSRSQDPDGLYAKHAVLPLIPLVVTPDGHGLQDSTPILEKMEAAHPEPSIHPDEPVADFISLLLEEFGDEWGNKWMFHYRWARPADQQSASRRIVEAMAPPGLGAEQIEAMAAQIQERMVNRVWFVGSSPETAPQIEDSFKSAMVQLNDHLASRPYLFGARPAFGDFAIWGQVYNAWTDPTCNEILESTAPNVVAWTQRLLDPKNEGAWEPWSALEPTLSALLRDQVGGLFLPWSVANAAAIAAGDETFTVELASGTWTQKPQKYHARSLAALRAKYAALDDRTAIDAVLARANCLAPLAG